MRNDKNILKNDLLSCKIEIISEIGKISLASLLKLSLDSMIVIGIAIYFILSKGMLMKKVVNMEIGRFIVTCILFSKRTIKA